MFQGASALSLDTKGRMSIPAKYRDVLSQAGRCITMTKHPDGCLLLFPLPEWEAFRSKIASLSLDAHWWRRIFLGNAVEVELDASGRVLVAPELRQAALLEKDLTLLGMGGYFELWDASTYAAKEQQAIALGMPEALKRLSF
jgi:MraZ protein